MDTLNLLLNQLATATDKKTKCQIITELGDLGNRKALKNLIRLLDFEKDNQVKSYASNAIIRICGKKMSILLLKSIRNESWVTRMKTAEILSEIKDKKGIHPLTKVLKNDQEASVRQWAAIALGNIKSKKATNALINALNTDTDWHVRMEAANALGNIKSKRIISALEKAFYTDEEYQVSCASASALAKINDEKSKNLLKELSNQLIDILHSEKNDTVIRAAARTLGEIGNETAAQLLVKKMKLSKEKVRLEINLALNKIAKRYNYKSFEDFVNNIQIKTDN